jgi:hypothetical protein
LLQPDGAEFSRGGGLALGAHAAARTGVAPSNEKNPLLFFVDVDMWFDAAFVFRCVRTRLPRKRKENQRHCNPTPNDRETTHAIQCKRDNQTKTKTPMPTGTNKRTKTLVGRG